MMRPLRAFLAVPGVAATGVVAATTIAGTPQPAATPAVTDVFVGGADGHAVYRIPSALRLRGGSVIAFAEARGSQADNGANDVVVRTSRDDGATWDAQRTVLDLPGRSLNNPCAVEVAAGPHAGRVLLMFQSYPSGKGEAEVAPGMDGPDTCRTLLVHSDDGGTTWSVPRDVTAGVKGPAPVTSTATGPGVGIQLARGPHAGRLVMPFNQGPFDAWRVYAALSDDGGETWRMGALAPEDPTGRGVGNEVQVAERGDGSVLLVARQFRGVGRRKVAVSHDGAATWTPLADSGELPDPSCMGGLAAVPGAGAPIAFTGPDSASKRVAGCAWFSWDGGSTWPRKVPAYAGSFAYSVPVPLGPDRLGVLFERDGCSRISWVTVPVPAAPRWEPEWQEEFDVAGAPDPRSWGHERGFVRNRELQWYQPGNARVAEGMLVIEARRERVPNPGFDPGAPADDWKRSRPEAGYTSASVTTKGKRSFRYGAIEARMRIDVRPGMWPALWSVGSGTTASPARPWPECGEIDIMEFYRGTLLANAAWGSATPGKATWDDVKLPIGRVAANGPDPCSPEAWAARFHVWRMERDAGRIRFLCDGVLLNEVDVAGAANARPDPDGTPASPLREPHHLIVNLAVGATGGDPGGTEFPGRLEVDWIRCWRLAD